MFGEKEKKEERFVKVSGDKDGISNVYVDRKTGIEYLYMWCGDLGGVTVLLDRDGKPLVNEKYLAEME